jgi:hypothetical protein
MMKWTEHVVRIGEMKNTYKSWSENMKGIDHLGELGVDERAWTGFIGLRISSIFA